MKIKINSKVENKINNEAMGIRKPELKGKRGK
jgi:hypothetical protein